MSAFIVLRFFLAVSNMGVYIMAFVIGKEVLNEMFLKERYKVWLSLLN